jgi:hypothetical protein
MMSDWEDWDFEDQAMESYLQWLEKRWHEDGIEPPEEWRDWLEPPP